MELTDKKLGILISTYGARMQSVIDTVLPTIDLSIARPIINHQRSDLYTGKIPDDERITYLKSDSVGLSKSRNECISKTPYEINLVADDDIEYIDGFEANVLKAFADTNADVITFQRKENIIHKKKTTPHNKKTILGVISCTVAFNKKFFEDTNVRFNPNYGVGTIIPFGGENLFLNDCIEADGTVLVNPEIIVSHPHESTGENRSMLEIPGRGIIFVKILGIWKGVRATLGVFWRDIYSRFSNFS
jgi:glycosyltransferase involved in cell wall biosynthesis